MHACMYVRTYVCLLDELLELPLPINHAVLCTMSALER